MIKVHFKREVEESEKCKITHTYHFIKAITQKQFDMIQNKKTHLDKVVFYKKTTYYKDTPIHGWQ